MTVTLTLRYLLEYARRPLNLGLLVVVPVIFVAVAADALTEFAQLISGRDDAAAIEAAAAGWAAAFLAGVAGFFHISGSHAADRRLAAAGAGAVRVVTARLASAALLAVLAAGGALLALWLAAGVADPPRAVGATAMFALIYLAIGATVGALVRSEVNGSLVIVFVWMLDVFLGPAIGGDGSAITRVFPTHFPTQVMLDAVSGHGGPLGDLGTSLAWTVGALGVALLTLRRSVRPSERRSPRRTDTGWSRLSAGLRYGFREYRRNTAMWALLVVVPVVFITLSFVVTPDDPAPVRLTEAGVRSTRVLSLIDVHGATMLPITVAFLSGLAGLFVTLGSAQGDRRLTLAGFRTGEVLAARLGVIGAAAVLTTTVGVAVTALDFVPQVWGTFVVAAGLVALTYGMVGVLVGSIFGRLGGLYVMFLVPFLDVGLAQNVMFDAAPPAWAAWLPAHGAGRVLVDAAFTTTFDEPAALLLAVGWLAGLTLVAATVFHRLAAPQRT